MDQKDKKLWWLLPIALGIGIIAGVAISFVIGTIYKNLQSGDGTYHVAESNGYTGKTEGSIDIPSPLESVVDYARHSAVTVLSKVDGQDYGIGSGTIIADQNGYYYVLTNEHVIDEMDEIYLNFYDLNNAQVKCEIVGSNAKEDIALVKVDKIALKSVIGAERFNELTVAHFGDSNEVEVGDGIFLLGNPSSVVFEHTVTCGIVSGLDKELTLDGEIRPYILVDAAMYFGNSGGGAYNYKGELIGVSGAKITVSGVYNMNLVLYGNTAEQLVLEFMENEN